MKYAENGLQKPYGLTKDNAGMIKRLHNTQVY